MRSPRLKAAACASSSAASASSTAWNAPAGSCQPVSQKLAQRKRRSAFTASDATLRADCLQVAPDQACGNRPREVAFCASRLPFHTRPPPVGLASELAAGPGLFTQNRRCLVRVRNSLSKATTSFASAPASARTPLRLVQRESRQRGGVAATNIVLLRRRRARSAISPSRACPRSAEVHVPSCNLRDPPHKEPCRALYPRAPRAYSST